MYETVRFQNDDSKKSSLIIKNNNKHIALQMFRHVTLDKTLLGSREEHYIKGKTNLIWTSNTSPCLGRLGDHSQLSRR